MVEFLYYNGCNVTAGQHDANDPAPEYEYTPWDGWYNNYAHPDWGGAGKKYTCISIKIMMLTKQSYDSIKLNSTISVEHK